MVENGPDKTINRWVTALKRRIRDAEGFGSVVAWFRRQLLWEVVLCTAASCAMLVCE